MSFKTFNPSICSVAVLKKKIFFKLVEPVRIFLNMFGTDHPEVLSSPDVLQGTCVYSPPEVRFLALF